MSILPRLKGPPGMDSWPGGKESKPPQPIWSSRHSAWPRAHAGRWAARTSNCVGPVGSVLTISLQAAGYILQAAGHIYMYLPLSAAEAHWRELRSSVLQADHAQSPAVQPRDAPFDIRFPLRAVHDSCFFFGGS
jgi:hypothetical protein